MVWPFSSKAVDGAATEHEKATLLPPKAESAALSGGALFKDIANNIFAGLLCGLLNLMYAVTFASIIFSNRYLSPYLHVGVCCQLATTVLAALVTTIGSSFDIGIAGPDPHVTPILQLTALSVANAVMFGSGTTTDAANIPDVLPTVLFAVSLTTVVTGIACLLLGILKLGRIIQFIPQPVAAGFLGGCGFLLVDSAFRVMCDAHFRLDSLLALPHDKALVLIVGVNLGLLIFTIHLNFPNFFTTFLPLLLVGAVGFVYVLFTVTRTTLDQAEAQGWLLHRQPDTKFYELWTSFSFTHVRLEAIFPRELSRISAALIVTFVTVLLNAAGVELMCDKEMNLDRELRVAGTANVLSGCAGGSVGFLLLSGTLLNYNAGATRRLAGFVALVMYIVFFFVGAGSLAYLPKPVLGGLVLYIGLYLIYEWMIKTCRRFSLGDYIQVWVIYLVIALVSFLPGLIAGMIIAVSSFAWRYSRVGIIKHVLTGADHPSSFVHHFYEQKVLEEKADQVFMLILRGYIFFGTSGSLHDFVVQYVTDRKNGSQRMKEGRVSDASAVSRHPVRFVILDFRLVDGVDSSSVLTFAKLKKFLYTQQVSLLLTNLKPSFESELRGQSILDLNKDKGIDSTPEPFCTSFADLDEGLIWAEKAILRSDRDILTRAHSRSVHVHLHEAFSDVRNGELIELLILISDLPSHAPHLKPLEQYLESFPLPLERFCFERTTHRIVYISFVMGMCKFGLTF
eukprot:GILJ01005853.1.p1 GENE.GILJ01005853.1~~GILJ01005853.1.p1  ORF type:complete len:736 (-),score=74.78 GILJ01005853.1:355-2562(-)